MMMPRMDALIFPENRSRALTLSYDDAILQDNRLVSILNKYQVKGTFNINSGLLGSHNEAKFGDRSIDISRIDPGELASLYSGHEVAGHGLYHSALERIGSPSAVYEIIEDKKRLEDLCGYLVRGFAYPFGFYSDNVISILQNAGYEYARVVETTSKFDLPTDFMTWQGTCHHKDENLMELAKSFCGEDIGFRRTKLFYLWGHSYEFDFDNNWNVIEEFCEFVSQYHDQIWFATNIEICDYINAFRALKYSADANTILNPSALDVWVNISGKTHKVESGATLKVF